MIISSSQVQNILKLQMNAYRQSGLQVEEVSASKGDTLVLSNTAQDMKLAGEVILKSPDVRADKVNKLKSQIAAGDYQISSSEIASKLVDRSLVDELAGR